MTESKEEQLPEQKAQGTRRRCPTCAAFVRLPQAILDTRKGKTIRLFECHCGERIWVDGETPQRTGASSPRYRVQ